MCDIVSCFAHLATEVFGMASVARVARVQLFSKKSKPPCGYTVAFMFFLYYFCENVHCAVCVVPCACE